MDRFLRDWREDAARKSQYEAAIFVGDKVLALTGSDVDALRLAQLNFSNGNYSRALVLLIHRDLVQSSAESKYLAAHCYVKQNRVEDALSILGEHTPHHLRQSSHSRRKIMPGDIHSKHSTLKHGKAAVRPEEDGPNNVTDKGNDADSTRFDAGMCYLRGLCHAKQNAFDMAKSCYMDAVRIDVQCFEAFDQLMKNALMSPDEEWEFLNGLDFDSGNATDNSSRQQAGELTKMLYTTRLSKYKNQEEFAAAHETLSTHYNLANNPDLLLAKAELLFTQCRFRDARALTAAILEVDRFNVAALPVHLACLYELGEKNALFLLAHEFADRHPEEPATWLAVGVYYLAIGKIAEARRYFSKSSMMDPHFGPAWVGFAHTFAAEGEHDQAISAYSTAARLFQGTHLPQLFLGMQSLQNANVGLARELLTVAFDLCNTDPLLLNELGVVFYHDGQLEQAVRHFKTALAIAADIDADPRAYLATRVNLGHAHRRLQEWPEALDQFDEVLRQGGREAGVFCAKGLVLLETGEAIQAVATLHEALAVSPQDPIANELLQKALEETSVSALVPSVSALGVSADDHSEAGSFGDDGFDAALEARKRDAVAKGKARARTSASAGRRRSGTGLNGADAVFPKSFSEQTY